jgi:plastocyanin
MRYEVALIALVVLASGCLNSTSTPETSSPANETSQPTELPDTDSNRVYLTGSGFTPSSITVQEGETVTWINNASQQMWVGSDRHPTHTEYSGSSLREHCDGGDQTSAAFDQCSTGDQFSFTFEKPGEWSYHNHENPGQTGTVVVE